MSPTLQRHWRSFRWAAWLGWQIEANWTQPWLFAIYSVIKPIASAFILVLMYFVLVAIGSGAPDAAMFNFVYVGNAFFIIVGSTLFGTFQVIQQDREWSQTLRYTYMSPISYYTYIVGRAITKVVVSLFAVIITLGFGVGFLGIRLSMSLDQVPLFIAAFLLGMLTLVGIGVCLAALSLMTARHVHGLAEGIPGLFYLFCGVLFPLTVLPDWGQAVGKALPLTYWFEITRRLVLPPEYQIATGISGDSLSILGLLAVSAVAFFLLSIGLFRGMEHLARKAGKLDMTTSY